MTPDGRKTRPALVGLSTYREQARWGVWDQQADLLPTPYARAVETSGGVPVLLPPAACTSRALSASADAVLGRLDALVVTGGADVNPSRYDEPAHPRTARAREDRDAWELALLDAAEAAGVPVLGICRGMQLMAVHAGGALDQHVPDRVGHHGHDPGADRFGATEVEVTPASRLAALVGDRQRVHCHHHQSVRTHPGFDAVAFAEDGTLEAMERAGGRFVLAVQWHPETGPDAGLFAGLVAAARP